ncbi:MAG: Fic family protein [Flavobacterium sp.]|nr:Fic family protein [Flavobacterium sp.]
MEEIKMALDLKKSLDKLRPIDVEQENRIMQKFRLDWNYHSNHLEGNSLNYGETKALLLFGITAQGKPLKDHFEITGHNEAINWVIDMVKGERPLTENFIRELHKLLLKEPYEVDAVTPDGKPTKRRITIGQYKTTPNHVKTKTGEIFYFATPEETPSKMFDLLQWFTDKTNEKEVNPIFLAVEFHYKFIRIHPFDDGNGRTARILMNFILMQFGFPPVIIKTEDKDNYFIALQLADAGNIEAFITYIAQNLVHSLELMIAGAKGENIEEEDDLDKEIALLEQKMKSSYITREDKANKLSLSLIDLIDGFYNIYLKFKKLYKNSDYKFYLNDELFVLEYDKNKLLNFLNRKFFKRIYTDRYFISFFLF